MSAGRLPFVPCVRFAGLAIRSPLQACSVKILSGAVNSTPAVHILKVHAENKPGQIQVIGRLDQFVTEHFVLRRITPAQTPPLNTGSITVAVAAGTLRKWEPSPRTPQVSPVRYPSSCINARVAQYASNKTTCSDAETRRFRSRHPRTRISNTLNHAYGLVRFALHSTPLTQHPTHSLQSNNCNRLRWSLSRRSWGHSLSRRRIRRGNPNRDEMPEYRSRMDVSLAGSDGPNVDNLLRIECPEEIATLEQRWINSWTSSVLPRLVRLAVHRVIAC
jgi:hypothetical protein